MSNRLPHLVVRADATPQIGSGHVMRCLALAQAWLKRGGTVSFLSHCQSMTLRDRIVALIGRHVHMGSIHPDPEDLGTTLRELAASSTSGEPLLVLDGYQFDARFHRGIRAAGYRLMVVDDYAHLPVYKVDVLLNQNLGSESIPYHCVPETLRLLGSQFALLREEFSSPPPEKVVSSLARRILVTFGGGDSHQMTSKVLEALSLVELEGLEVIVVLGANNTQQANLANGLNNAGFERHVRVVENASNMADLLAWADLAISAGGSTCWELARMGTPSLLVAVAENQVRIVEEMVRAGAALSLGWWEEIAVSHMAVTISEVCADSRRRASMIRAGRSIVDGRGCDRVIDALVALPPLRSI